MHASYLRLQYPLLFGYGEDGYRDDVQHMQSEDTSERKRNKVTIKEFLCFILQSWEYEAETLLCSRRLFQQFIIDGYNMMESKWLFYITTHQKQLRCDKYNTLSQTQHLN